MKTEDIFNSDFEEESMRTKNEKKEAIAKAEVSPGRVLKKRGRKPGTLNKAGSKKPGPKKRKRPKIQESQAKNEYRRIMKHLGLDNSDLARMYGYKSAASLGASRKKRAYIFSSLVELYHLIKKRDNELILDFLQTSLKKFEENLKEMKL